MHFNTIKFQETKYHKCMNIIIKLIFFLIWGRTESNPFSRNWKESFKPTVSLTKTRIRYRNGFFEKYGSEICYCVECFYATRQKLN